MEPRTKVEYLPRDSRPVIEQPEPSSPRTGESGGVLQMISITPGVACAAIGGNLMLDQITWATLGLGFCLQLIASLAIGYFALEMQRQAHDPERVARAKAILLFALSVLPVPLSPFIAGPAGLAGLVRKFRK